jgi:nucleoside 2-deoxyribosyltransferase
MSSVKLYIAGKIIPNSPYTSGPAWRDSLASELSCLTQYSIVNLDPRKFSSDSLNDQGNSRLIYGRNNYLISRADIVLVNLTDDISVGGSQEMLIAKYYQKPLIGLAPRGGKFNAEVKIVLGKEVHNYIDPYVFCSCDYIAEDIFGVAALIVTIVTSSPPVKSLTFLEDVTDYYLSQYYGQDTYVHELE